ncbi:MAG: CopG family transcriptional regulator [Psychrilyobacter sp.]|uniref:CopG family transcriptional regulator n=1 Tax=Psychrilyobacter sp. TaxID=2586924 RepID=UPI003C7757AB
MKKIGRPKVESPKNIDIKVRIDEETNKKLLEYCKINNISRAEAVRKGIDKLLRN